MAFKLFPSIASKLHFLTSCAPLPLPAQRSENVLEMCEINRCWPSPVCTGGRGGGLGVHVCMFTAWWWCWADRCPPKRYDTWQRAGVLSLNSTECPGTVTANGAVELCSGPRPEVASEEVRQREKGLFSPREGEVYWSGKGHGRTPSEADRTRKARGRNRLGQGNPARGERLSWCPFSRVFARFPSFSPRFPSFSLPVACHQFPHLDHPTRQTVQP